MMAAPEWMLASGNITQTDFGYTGQRNEAYMGLMDYRSRWYDHELGRFVSPDSIIPNLANPQNLNRYSYVRNSPIEFNDPSGHSPVCTAAIIDGVCQQWSGLTGVNASAGFERLTDKQANAKMKATPQLGSKSKGKGVGGNYNDQPDKIVSSINTLATASQDVATVIDLGFAIPEVVVGLIGLLSGGPETLPVVVGGMDIAWNLSGANGFETGFGLTSLIFTGIADRLDDGQFGDATLTSASTFVAGALMVDPIGDLVIDGYGSGYNHGIFIGIDGIMNGNFIIK